MNAKKQTAETDVEAAVNEQTELESGGGQDMSAEVKRLEAELAELKDKHLRLLAEFENYKKRTAREYAELMRTANDRIIVQTLDVVDNFERALDMTQQQMSEESCDNEKLFSSLHEGARMIHQQLTDLLKRQGVEEIPAEGKPFDPELHEATLQITSGEHPEDHVVQVLSKGYQKDGRVLRHAKVGVSKSPGKERPVSDGESS